MLKKLLIIFTIIFFFTNLISINAAVGVCTVKNIEPGCASNEKAIFSLYQSADSHVKIGTTGPWLACCPAYLNLSGSSGTGNSCGSNIINSQNALLFKSYQTTDAHVSAPGQVIGSNPTNICLSFANDIDGNQLPGSISCSVKSTCIGNEVGVASLYQLSDSHVGPYTAGNYANKICCSINQCPTNFIWGLNEETGGYECLPIFATCLLQTDSGTDSGIDLTYACKELWRTPVSQTGDYWNDALTPLTDDCFATSNSPDDNGRACCFKASYLGNTYGSYLENGIIKEPISEILQD